MATPEQLLLAYDPTRVQNSTGFQGGSESKDLGFAADRDILGGDGYYEDFYEGLRTYIGNTPKRGGQAVLAGIDFGADDGEFDRIVRSESGSDSDSESGSEFEGGAGITFEMIEPAGAAPDLRGDRDLRGDDTLARPLVPLTHFIVDAEVRGGSEDLASLPSGRPEGILRAVVDTGMRGGSEDLASLPSGLPEGILRAVVDVSEPPASPPPGLLHAVVPTHD